MPLFSVPILANPAHEFGGDWWERKDVLSPFAVAGAEKMRPGLTVRRGLKPVLYRRLLASIYFQPARIAALPKSISSHAFFDGLEAQVVA